MPDVRLDEELWSTRTAPEGCLERWRAEQDSDVAKGQPLADVRIEDALHTILAPCAGRLRRLAAQNAIVEPGAAIATLE